MTAHPATPVIMLLLTAIAAGCGTTPSSREYTLNATAAAATRSSIMSISVGPVSLPAEVDRPQIVVSTGVNAMRIDDFNRWASPLQDNLARVIAENLGAILGTPRVSLFPQTSAAHADYSVAVDVRRFESLPARSATLDAVWSVRTTGAGTTQTGRTRVNEAVRDDSYEALAAAHSRALGRLSQDIANVIAP
jgi:uncharacterized lipoprotein YmbA